MFKILEDFSRQELHTALIFVCLCIKTNQDKGKKEI